MVPAACASDRHRLTQICARRTGRIGEARGRFVDCADVVIRHDVAEVLPLVLNEVMCDE